MIRYKMVMTMKPPKKPAMGDEIMGTTTLCNRPSMTIPPVFGSVFWKDHLMTCQLLPADARAAPHKPPIRAWLELDGNPTHHVIRFQTIPPIMAARIVSVVT